MLAFYHKLGRAIDRFLLFGVLGRLYTYRDRTFAWVEKIDEAGATFNLFRREALEAAGGLFDEQFALLFNDVDLYKRIITQGYVSYVLPDCPVVHLGSLASRKLDAKTYRAQHFEGLFRYFRKYHRLDYALLCLAWPQRHHQASNNRHSYCW